MKRTHSSSDAHDHDNSSIGLHSNLNDCNNELAENLTNEADTKNVVTEDQQMSQSKESNETRNTQSILDNDKDIDQSHFKDDDLKVISKTPEKKPIDVNKLNEVKGELLLEAISSDDDIAMDSEDCDQETDIGEDFDECTNDITNDFVPSLFQATPLRSIHDPSLSFYEYIYRKLGDDSKCEEAAELMDCLEYLQSKNIDINEKWVVTAERTVLILPKTLCHILNIPEYCHKLFSLVNVSLDLNCALKEHVSMSTLIIRHLKVGLQLIEALCHYNEDLSEHLIKHHQIHNKLLNLFFVEHMCLSLKLNILHALDSSLNGSEPIRLFLYSGVYDKLNGYETLLKILSVHQRPRVCFLVTSILRKIHFYELLQKLNANVKILDSNSESSLQECLAEITTTYIKAPILMGCPKRFLQARAQFELTPALTHSDVYPTIYRLFDDSSLISCITQVLDKPNIEDSLKTHFLKFLHSLMDYDHGLRYLGCRSKELNELIKVLNKVDNQFNLTLIYKVKILALVNYLSYFWECNLTHNFKLDQIESVDILHDLFLLTQSTVGKFAVVNVLTMGDNLDVILNFFKYMEQSRSKNDDLHIMYSLDLMKIVLEFSDDVCYLKKYGTLIYELACKHNCIHDLIAWTFPVMKKSVFFHDDVTELCNIVKNNIDNCLNLNKTLITCLRILKYLGIPNDETPFESVEDFVELKYKYIALQMYSCNLLGHLLTIVEKVCDNYKQPSINVENLTGNHAKHMISIIRPSMVLIRCMITLLIQSRSNAFNDLSPIKILLKLYNLMHHVPENSIIQEDATRVAKDVCKTLEAYIETKIGYLMINEVIVWTLSSPSIFLPGLVILCQLLPSPLPMQTKKPLEDSTVTAIISFHNMWTDHLVKVNNDLIELITVLGPCSLLEQPMRFLCVKISNLSMSLCALVVQSLLDILISTDSNDYFNKYLSLLTHLCEHAIIKTTVLQILNEKNSEENYKKFFQKICENIKINAQECNFLFVKSLCDSDNVLETSRSEKILPRDNFLNKYFLNSILNIFLELFNTITQFSKLCLIIETCLVIIKNDYGFYHFKVVLDLFSKSFYNIFNYLSQHWDKEENHCENSLILTVQLLNLCIRDDCNTKRVLFMNTQQLKEYLNWSNDNKNHPINLLKEITQKDNCVCYTNLVDLEDLLNNDQEPTILELIEPQLTVVDLLTPTFKDRLFYEINSTDENYSNPNTNICIDVHDNLVECNIEEVIQDLPDFNIKDKINDLFQINDCITQPEPIVHKQHEPIMVEKKENINTSVISSTPIRHKVFSRLGTIQRPDAFRNRLPNTSRPPSLHVDDFVAMETRSARQPRYKLPIQPIQDLNIRLRERQMAYERTYSLLSPYKSHLSLQSWHAQVSAMAHLRADYHQTISSRHIELHRHSLVAEWRQLRVEAALRKKRAYSRR